MIPPPCYPCALLHRVRASRYGYSPQGYIRLNVLLQDMWVQDMVVSRGIGRVAGSYLEQVLGPKAGVHGGKGQGWPGGVAVGLRVLRFHRVSHGVGGWCAVLPGPVPCGREVLEWPYTEGGGGG